MLTMVEAKPPLVEVAGLKKSYGAVQALRGADFEVRAGEVMALLGENGSGKSTLVKVLSGLVARDEGTVRINGAELDLSTPAASREAGVATVTQEFSLVGQLNAAENVFLGSGLRGSWNQARLQRRAAPFLDSVGLGTAERRKPVGELSVGERQLIEVARVLARDARILIFDEPTAALSDVEIARILDLVRRLAADGRSIVYVTHRLGEVFEIGDRATVMRDGQSQEPIEVADTDVRGLITRMLGRELTTIYPDRAERIGPPLLNAVEVTAPGLREPVDLTVGEGEIVGLAGQLGSGAGSLLEGIAGLSGAAGGRLEVDGRPVPNRGLAQAIKAGIAYCSPDRKRDGIFELRSVADNLTAPSLRRVTPLGWFSPGRSRRLAGELAARFAIQARRLDADTGTLSGGNQQKVAVGKWIGIEPRVLLVEEPTRGVDVGARAEIYGHLRELADEGMGIVFASSDLAEVAGLADTVVTFYRGRVVRSAPAVELPQAELMADVTHGPEVAR
ncbi:MAG: sugar ABC transporter ATP-binding protein [Actinobacteria bacterium]|nr:sugar ABC transporter ATP-binding protein [Actinomycetota bacterium]